MLISILKLLCWEMQSQMRRSYLSWNAHQLSMMMENLNAKSFGEAEQMGCLGSPEFTAKGIIQLDLVSLIR